MIKRKISPATSEVNIDKKEIMKKNSLPRSFQIM